MPAAALQLLGDEKLFKLAAAGEPRAFEAIYDRHHQALYRYCRSIVGNEHDASDALQSTMASALRALVGESREIALKPWLFRIAHNECISLLRRRRPHAEIDDALALEAPAHDPALRERLLELVADMRELPDAQRGALVMHELSGLRYREIAVALDTTEPHARQLVYEARTALHDLAEGRAMECESARRAISDSDGRVMRGRRIRAHLRACSGCRDFDALIHSRRRDLAVLAPPLPALAAAGLLHKVLGGSSGGASTAAASSSGAGGMGSLLAGKAAAGSMVAKAAAVLAVAAAAGTGAAEVASIHHSSHSGPASVRSHSSSAGGSGSAQGGGAAGTLPAATSGPSGGAGAPQAGAHSHAGAPAGAQHGAGRGHSHAKPAHPSHPLRGQAPVRSHPPHPATPQHPSRPSHPNAPAKSHPAHPVAPAPPPKAKPPVTHSPAVTLPKPPSGNAPVAGGLSGTSGAALPPVSLPQTAHGNGHG